MRARLPSGREAYGTVGLPREARDRLQWLAILRYHDLSLSGVGADILYPKDDSGAVQPLAGRIDGIKPLRYRTGLPTVSFRILVSDQDAIRHRAIDLRTTSSALYAGMFVPYVMSNEVTTELLVGMDLAMEQIRTQPNIVDTSRPKP